MSVVLICPTVAVYCESVVSVLLLLDDSADAAPTSSALLAGLTFPEFTLVVPVLEWLPITAPTPENSLATAAISPAAIPARVMVIVSAFCSATLVSDAQTVN